MTGWSAEDDLPEAIELPGKHFALGVIWHPEEDESSKVIAALVEAARSSVVPLSSISGQRNHGTEGGHA